MVVRKDAASKASPESQADTASTEQPTAAPSTESFPAVLPSTVVNIALHSLLMVTVPFVLFFASHFGALDREWLVHYACTAVAAAAAGAAGDPNTHP